MYSKIKFGVAKDIITPDMSTTMIGFGTMFGAPFTDIHDDLYVRTLILRDADGETVILMGLDLLFHDDTLPNALRDYISEKYGISRDNLHVSYSHTHYGPAVKGYDFTWYKDEYEAFILSRCKSSIDRAMLNMRDGRMKYASVAGEWNISRRLPMDGEIMFKPNADGEVDKNIYLLKLEDENGKMRALAINFACHPSNLCEYHTLSSEYPGRLCQKIEGEFYGCTALFFQGFGSDAKLRIGARKKLSFSGITYEECDEVALSMMQRIKTKLVDGGWQDVPLQLGSKLYKLQLPVEVYPREHYLEVKEKYADDPQKHFERVPGTFETSSRNYSHLTWACAEYVLDNYDNLPDYVPLNCGVIRLNPDFYIFSMGGEPGCNIGTVLRETFPEKQLICFGYNDAIAYVPSDKMIEEGGYEAAAHSINEYRLKGKAKKGVDKIYCDCLKDAIDTIK